MPLIPCTKSFVTGPDHLVLNTWDKRLDVQWSGCTTPRLQDAAIRLQTQLGVQLPLTINCLSNSPRHPELNCNESYQLEVDSKNKSIVIRASTEWGILRSFGSLCQLVRFSSNPALATLQSCKIKDSPAFTWRGLMLDPARHFLSANILKETLDVMFLFKLNVLHLHLSDDQGFRFFSPTYPELAEVGGEGDYYTTEQLKDLVQYASARGIRIIPELDIPGHCTSWLAARPEWGAPPDKTEAEAEAATNKPGSGHPSYAFGGHKACLDPGNPEVYKALATLLDELAEVFPDEYVHLGGDEVNPEWWNTNSSVQKFMRTQQLNTVSDLQNHFMTRVAKLANDRGKKVVGWDEILHPELSRSVVVQSWRTAKYRDIALENGFDCVFSSAYYLDLFYPADIHYGFVPDADPQELNNQETKILDDVRLAHIQELTRWLANFHDKAANKMLPSNNTPGQVLGGEACMWSELVSEDLLHTRIWSRMPAIAERFWSGDCTSADIYPRLEAAWQCMKHCLKIDIYGPIEQFIASFNTTAEEKRLLGVLLYNLEPVKGYARLLGDQANARVSGNEISAERPYKRNTPLTRIVDLLPPESLTARNIVRTIKMSSENTDEDATIKALVRDWSEQLVVVRKLLDQDTRLAEVVALSESLASLGELLTTHSGIKKPVPESLTQAVGELIMPIALGLSEL